MNPRPLRVLVLLTAAAVVLQLLAGCGVARLRGSATAYACESPDSAEYVALARGLAFEGQFVRVDEAGRQLAGPDTWRTPGYPLFLAILVRLLGDETLHLLLGQQVLAVAAVPLLYLLLRRVATPAWATAAALAWAADPFRLYYSQWLLAETLFVFLLLVGSLLYVRARESGWTWPRSLGLGLLAGAAVLVRPIGVLLPVLAVLAALWTPRDAAGRRRFMPVVLCALGVIVSVGPWLARNRIVAGHWALSHQAGASFAYHKVTDVLLWAQGNHDHRFDPGTLDTVRTMIDRRLQQKWQERFGMLTPRQREQLTWQKLNFGQSEGIDPFVTSELLWEVGWEMLAGRRADLLACCVTQGVGLFVFPLNLLIDPPAGSRSAPLSLLGDGRTRVSWAVAAAVGCAYAALALTALCRLLFAACGRRGPARLFAFWPLLVLFLPVLPFEDPRFRLTLVPMLWLLAVGRSNNPSHGSIP